MGAQAGVWVVTIGVVAAQVTPWAPRPVVAAAAAAAALSSWGVCRRSWLGWLALGLLAVTAGLLRLEPLRHPELPPAHVGRLPLPVRGLVAGTVEDIRYGRRGRAVLTLATSTVDHGGRRYEVRGRVRLGLRGGVPKLRPGDDLRVATTLRTPRNFANPGSFDFVGHLARRGIHVTASVWDSRALIRRARPSRGIIMRLRRWRARLARAIARAAPGTAAPVLEALVLGADDRITPALRDAFTRAGVVHVLSVSGLHIGMVAAGSWAVLRWLLARSERVLLAIDVRRLAAVGSLGPVGLYGALAGLEAATLRSVLMTGAAACATLLGRPADVGRLLALAALMMALATPGAPAEIGYQLSFVSVAALVAGVARWAPGAPAGWSGRIRLALVAAASASLGTAPLTALHFQQVAPMAVLANPLVVPLFGSLVVGLGLCGAALEPVAPGAAHGLFTLAGRAVQPGIALVTQLARPAWAAIDVPRPDAWEIVLLYAGLAALVTVGRWRWAAPLGFVAAVGLAVDAAIWWQARWAPGVLRATFLDVGQGDATVVELPDGRVLVVDAGGFAGSDFDTGSAIVAPFLATRKIRQVDALVMTHAHPDHFGGLAHLVRSGRIGALWWSGWTGDGVEWRRLESALETSGVPLRTMGHGGVRDGPVLHGVDVLHPTAGWNPAGLNDTSIVLRVRLGETAILLTGDIEAGAEARLRHDVGDQLAAVVLKAPHHGSRTSSTRAFLEAVRPRVVVISVGAGNRYGLPAAEVEARYRALGACVLRTDRCGAVTVVADGRGVGITAVRPDCGCPGGIAGGR